MIEQKKMDPEGAAFEAWYAQDVGVTAERVKSWRFGESYREEYEGACSAWKVWQARASLPVGVPDGWKLVPVDPTPEMIQAALDKPCFDPLGDLLPWTHITRTSYAAMLAAAPTVKPSFADDPRKPHELSAAGCRCVRFGEGNPHWPCPIHAAPTVKAEQVQAMPQEWWQIIHDTLRDYRMSTLGDGEGGGYPLIDAMTADGQSVAGGIEECTYLADAIWNALPTQAPSLPAAGSDELPEPTYESIYRAALSAAEEVEVVAWRYRHSKQEKWQAGVERKSLWEAEPLMTVAQHNRIVAALSAQQPAPAYGSYTTRPAEAVAGIALRQLGDESRWVEIRDLNAHAFPGIGPHDYYPVGTVLRMPAEQQSAPERVSVPEGWRPVIAMVLQALDRDAAEGKAARGEMAAELRALLNGGGES